jgi:hypothetical protein
MIPVQLLPDEIARIYRVHLLRDFPSGEVKPYFAIKSLLKRQMYACYGLFESPAAGSGEADSRRPDLGSLLAYAFLCGSRSDGFLLIDYFAVVPRARQQGIGSQFLQQLAPLLPWACGLAAEIENVGEAPDGPERQTRQRRLDFYLRNGFSLTGVSGHVFGVNYDIVYRPLLQQLDDASLLKHMDSLYRNMVPRLLFHQNVAFKQSPSNGGSKHDK